MDIPDPVIDQDEIVSCAVHFGETQHGIRLTQQGVEAILPPGLSESDRIVGSGIARSRFNDYLSRRKTLGARVSLGFLYRMHFRG